MTHILYINNKQNIFQFFWKHLYILADKKKPAHSDTKQFCIAASLGLEMGDNWQYMPFFCM